MTPLLTVFAAMLGAALGSFLNVLVHRVPRGESILAPASRCPVCETQIRPRDNIPVVSYIVLRGRCRACRARIEPRYVLVELATAMLWSGAVLRFGASEPAAFVALAGTILLALAAIDLEHRRLPNVIVLPACAGAAAWVGGLALATGNPRPAMTALGAGAGFFALLLGTALVSGGIGFGDVKLALFVGIVSGRFGVGVAAAAVLGSFILGGLVAAGLVSAGRRGRKDVLPFGPAMAAGTLLALFAGRGPVSHWLGL
jgi:leader peptidase (prepilin peptidase)/N-methyltransferase